MKQHDQEGSVTLEQDELLHNFRDLELIKTEWLHRFHDDRNYGSLEESSKMLVDMMWESLRKREYRRTWELYDYLRKQVKAFGVPEEIGDADVECACIEFRIGRLPDAKQRLLDASERYLSNDHDHTVALWMLGIAHWWTGDPEQRMKAVFLWQECRGWFAELGERKWFEELSWKAPPEAPPAKVKGDKKKAEKKNAPMSSMPSKARVATEVPLEYKQLGEQRHQWYRARCAEIDKFLVAVKGELAPRVPVAAEIKATVAEARPGVRPIRQPRIQGMINVFPILGSPVAAGDFKNMPSTDFADYVSLEEVRINGKPYSVYSLRQSKVISLRRYESEYLIRVQGHSMNNYPIFDGDYVLIDPGVQTQAGDIVVTEIVHGEGSPNEDYGYTLKKLKSIGNQEIVLEFDSTYPEYKDANGSAKQIHIDLKQNPQVKMFVAQVLFTPKPEEPDEPAI